MCAPSILCARSAACVPKNMVCTSTPRTMLTLYGLLCSVASKSAMALVKPLK